jgi:hypothetical protein
MKKRSPLVLTMPLPPTADHVTSAQLAWRKRALAEIESQRLPEHRPIGDHARVRVLVGVVHGRALVEIIPAAIGILADGGVIEQLAVISDILTRWDKIIEPGRVRIEISAAVPPLRRIGAVARERIRKATARRWAARLNNSSSPCVSVVAKNGSG